MSTETTQTTGASSPPPIFDIPVKAADPVAPTFESKPQVVATPAVAPTQEQPAATAAQVEPAKPAIADPAKPAEKTDEQKAAEAKTDKPAEGEKPEKPVVPEKYDLKLSDGSLLKQASLDRIAAHAKAQGLSQEDAQALVKAQEGEVKTAMDQAVQERANSWLESAKSDKEIGGEKLAESVSLAKNVLDKYGDKPFRDELSAGGFGNHPGLIRLLARVGKASKNDVAIISQTAGAPKKSAADTLYDKTPKS